MRSNTFTDLIQSSAMAEINIMSHPRYGGTQIKHKVGGAIDLSYDRFNETSEDHPMSSTPREKSTNPFNHYSPVKKRL